MKSDYVQLLTHIFSSLVVSGVLGWLMYGARRQALLHPSRDKFVLAYGREMRWLSAIFLAAAGVMVWVADAANPREKTTAALVSGGFVVLVTVLALEAFRVRVEFSGEHIRCFSPWRSDRDIPWRDVTSIRYSSALQWWVVTTRGHGHIRLHAYLTGVDDFLATAEAAGIKVDGPRPITRSR